MIELIWDSGFKKSYKKRIKNNSRLKEKFWQKLNIFVENPYDDRLKTHKLHGKLNKLYAFSVDYDCRVIFEFIDKNVIVLLIDIGNHDEVY